jgi:acetyl esterase/lipase
MKTFPDTGEITHEFIIRDRKDTNAQFTSEIVTSDPEISSRDISFPGPDGNNIELTIVQLKNSAGQSRPCIYHIHGGGFVMGNRFMSLNATIPLIKEFDLVVVTVEYRLAPESKAPAQVEDSYAGLKWTADHASDLGIDAAKIITYGGSAGGGLAAGVTLLARDRKVRAMSHLSLVTLCFSKKPSSFNRLY